MMKSAQGQIAEAIVDHLNGTQFPSLLTFEARYVNLALMRQEELVGLNVYVAPTQTAVEQVARGYFLKTHTLVVGFVRPIRTATVVEQDEMLQLVDLVVDSLINRPMAGFNFFQLNNEATRVLLDTDQMASGDVFVAAFELSYQG